MVCIMVHFQVVFLAPHSVSVPEKTLEHWSSQYVTYLYRSWAALWWPTRGEDIDVRLLPTRPGRAVQLELKTTTVAGVGLHDVSVDLGQLWEYRQRPLGAPTTLHLEELWIKNVTITTGLVDDTTVPLLLQLVRPGKIADEMYGTHDFALHDMMAAYDTFAEAGKHNALKVVIRR
jgi:hypothetical protein